MQLGLIVFCLAVGLVRVFANPTPPKDCCLSVSNQRVNVTHILRYKDQEAGQCPVKAVMFYLENKRILCSDPANAWTKLAILKIDQRAVLLSLTNPPLNSRWPPEPATEGTPSEQKHFTKKPQHPKRSKKVRVVKKKKIVRIKGGKRKRGPKRTTMRPNTTTYL